MRQEFASGRARVPIFLVAVSLLHACASAPPPPASAPVDAGQLALSAERASSLDASYRVFFDWSLDEPGTRLRGRGVARVEPPFRARLDLFLSNGETAAVAAMLGDDIRIVEGGRAELPPPPLLWGVLGVFHPGESSALRGGSLGPAEAAELRYIPAGGGEIRYFLQGNRIEGIDVVRAERTREELRLVRPEGERFPREATYRDLDQVRELRITVQTVERAEAFPSDIWDPSS